MLGDLCLKWGVLSRWLMVVDATTARTLIDGRWRRPLDSRWPPLFGVANADALIRLLIEKRKNAASLLRICLHAFSLSFPCRLASICDTFHVSIQFVSSCHDKAATLNMAHLLKAGENDRRYKVRHRVPYAPLRSPGAVLPLRHMMSHILMFSSLSK